MAIIPLKMEYITDNDERRLKVVIYSLFEDFVDYAGFVFNGMVWTLRRRLYEASPDWIESESGLFGSEREVLSRARDTSSQAIRTNLALDEEIKTAIIDAHTYNCLRDNGDIYSYSGEEIPWLNRKL